MEKITGKTKDVGYQFGIRKTFSFPLEKAWDFLFSDKGICLWLGELEEELEFKKPFKTKEGVEGFVRVFKTYSHIRINWKKKKWDNMSTVQLRLIRQGEKTMISFHQEKLLDSGQREEMKEYWNSVVEKLSKKLITLNRQ